MREEKKELYVLIEWNNGQPIIDGAKFAETKQKLIDYYNTLHKIIINLGIEYTICRIERVGYLL